MPYNYRRSTHFYWVTELVNNEILFDYMCNKCGDIDGYKLGVYDTIEEAMARFEAEKAHCRTDRIRWDTFEADLLWLEEEKFTLDENGIIDDFESQILDSYAQPYVEECEKDEEDDED